MRDKNSSYKRVCGDLTTLGFRHRRGHDLRRTMISLARGDGASGDILEICTHKGGGRGRTIDLYTTYTWEAKCVEVSKLRIQRPAYGQVLVLARAANDAPAASANDPEGEPAPYRATELATPTEIVSNNSSLKWWRRRESNRTKGLPEKPNKVAPLAGIALQTSPIRFADGCRPLPSCSVLGSRVTARVQH
jgi:hypothetical protein